MPNYRPYFTGLLKLSLVTVPVRLYTATTEREKISFNMIHAPSGERVKQQLVVPSTGAVAERSDIVKGYEYEKGRYITIDPAELAELKLDTTDAIEIDQFVDADEVPAYYADQPYYLTPDGAVGDEGYRAIRDALAKSGKVAIGRVVIAQQERTLAIRPHGKGLIAQALRYQDELKPAAEIFAEIPEAKTDKATVGLVEQLIAAKTEAFDPAAYRDSYQDAVRELVQAKLKGVDRPKKAKANPPKVGNLMDVLKAALADTAANSNKKARKAA